MTERTELLVELEDLITTTEAFSQKIKRENVRQLQDVTETIEKTNMITIQAVHALRSLINISACT